MTDMPIATVSDVVAAALVAYGRLAELGEDVDDEWSYIQDLTAAWAERLETVVAVGGNASIDPAVGVAIERAIDEIGRISDPHRAIDWLSTFPQVVLVALGDAS